MRPIDWMHTLSHDPQSAESFHNSFGLDSLDTFWQAQDPENPKMVALEGVQDKSKCIPLFIHQDAGEFQDRDSLNVVSMGSMLNSAGNSLDKNLLIAAWPKSCESPSTWKTIWLWIVWCFQAMLTGIFPSADPWKQAFDPNSKRGQLAGKPILKGGYTAVLWAMLADMKCLADEFGLSCQPNAHDVCFLPSKYFRQTSQ